MKALIIVDVQYDFLPGGNLAVQRGDEIIPTINQMIKDYELVIFTRDFHPANHKSFASQHKSFKPFDRTIVNEIDQVLWPDHCIQGTRGSDIHEDLIGNPELRDKEVYIFKKGMDPEYDSYSGFFDANGASTGLGIFLANRGVDQVFVCGLALDYCVYWTAMDAVKSGLKTSVIVNATKGIDPKWSISNLSVKGIDSHLFVTP